MAQHSCHVSECPVRGLHMLCVQGLAVTSQASSCETGRALMSETLKPSSCNERVLGRATLLQRFGRPNQLQRLGRPGRGSFL